jgi:signal transduction histidine kinase
MLEDLASKEPPHVLVLDWHMPDMSGIEVCGFVRQTRDMAQLPILILTATRSSESLLDALAAGANDFVTKPFSEAELNARVAALVSTASLNARLVEAERRLRVEAEFRERFMGMLAHDLRQPLNAILMANQALSRLEVSADKRQDFLELQLRAAGRMQRMIGELLDFTRNRPETGLPIQRQVTDFEQIVRASLEEIRHGNLEHALELTVEGSCRGEWDPDRLAQVCGNLFGNAIEHAPRGSTVDIRLIAQPEEVELRVTNGGAEIPESVRVTLFQAYRRGLGVKRSKGGVGLGLHIVQQIVLAHGGTVSVESDGGTTEFVVRLPRQTPLPSV